jgi:hypothetical protein
LAGGDVGHKKNVRNRKRRPFLEVINLLLAKAMPGIRKDGTKVTVADLFRAVDLKRELFPPPEAQRKVRWFDGRD